MELYLFYFIDIYANRIACDLLTYIPPMFHLFSFVIECLSKDHF